MAVEPLVEILGKAAARLSLRTRQALRHDWEGLKAMRNVIAHQYGQVKSKRLLAVVQAQLPGLVRLLEER